MRGPRRSGPGLTGVIMAWFPGHSGQKTGEPGILAADQFPIWKFYQASTAVAFLDPALKLVALASDTLKVIVRHFPSVPLHYPRIASSCFPHNPIPYHFLRLLWLQKLPNAGFVLETKRIPIHDANGEEVWSRDRALPAHLPG